MQTTHTAAALPTVEAAHPWLWLLYAAAAATAFSTSWMVGA